ncbi:acetyltransferase, GNAT family [Synechococcus sp. PCC 7335]|uniref:GNAT family N-acetyltransferase n=1 Tax=Synechococcus sp. (strain ATCC 29403 / PCC 7335) TaxID=91464 RepID=UPI00017ED93F|nr:GNAT family N-acetyltransferase [Synechococcus sp. PCC 7335]EDX86869.1 acetyltransferase, GNAT family [Synechococcus sp. PCC 7335]
MRIRDGRLQDASQIAELLGQLGYAATTDFVENKLNRLIQHSDAQLIVAIENVDRIIGFASLHFIPQLGVEGDFCRISYFCVDHKRRSRGIGKRMEAAIVESAIQRQCDRIEVHCHIRRSSAHKFYARQGYVEDPKYLLKQLSDRTQRSMSGTLDQAEST